MLTTFLRSACLAAVVNTAFMPLVLASDLTKGDLTIKLYPLPNQGSSPSDCFKPYQKAGTYHIAGGVSGVLYPTNCTGGSDASPTFKFVDVSGSENCVGRMVIGLPYEGAEHFYSEWIVDGAVRGYRCSTVGKTFTIRDMR